MFLKLFSKRFRKLEEENKTLRFCLNFWEKRALHLEKDKNDAWKEEHSSEEATYKVQIMRLEERLKYSLDWIKTNSKCTTCKGDPNNTMGLIPCKECGLIGNAPWPG